MVRQFRDHLLRKASFGDSLLNSELGESGW